MVMPVMKGGGAERVASLLMNEFHRCGHEVKFLLTSSKQEDVVRTDLNEEIPLVFLQEQKRDVFAKGLRVFSSIICHVFEALKKPVLGYFAYLSFISQYGSEIKQLRQMMKENPDLTVITFLQPSIPMVVLAAKDLPNKIIISERGNPERLMKKRYGEKFVEKYYGRINVAVFQTENAKNVYPARIADKGIVIPNPIKQNLPEPYDGVREKRITTFCRISAEKNLPMLLEAFSLLNAEYPDYCLRIIGNPLNSEGEKVKRYLVNRVKELQMDAKVEFQPFSAVVHELIKKDKMYVNCSDYEGLSNAMLEAMALGLPVICTDCPIGGAKTTIQDGVNGLLIPVNDIEALYRAMKTVIENQDLAKEMSQNAVALRQKLDLEVIARRWMELI